MSDDAPNEKAEIHKLQIDALLRFVDQQRRSFIIRAAMKLDREFFSVSFSEKIAFLGFLTKWIYFHSKSKIKKFIFRFIHIFSSHRKTKESKLAVAVHLSGGIGDLVNAAAFLNAFTKKYPDTHIDIFFHSLSSLQFVFAGAPYVRKLFHEGLLKKIIDQYDLILTLTDWLNVEINHNSSYYPTLKTINALFIKQCEQLNHHALYRDKHPLLSGFYANLMVEKNYNRVTAPGYFLDLTITDEDLKIFPKQLSRDFLSTLSLEHGNYITVHDGFDNYFLNKTSVSTKQWSIENWTELCTKIREKYPELKIVQLGAKNSRLIPNVTLSLIKKTTLEEAGEILRHARFHLDGESGLTRIAAALGVPSIVMFGPTNYEYFSLPNNINIRPNKCGNCFWFSNDWMAKCPRQLPEPACLASITPQQIMDIANQLVIGSIK